MYYHDCRVLFRLGFGPSSVYISIVGAFEIMVSIEFRIQCEKQNLYLTSFAAGADWQYSGGEEFEFPEIRDLFFRFV